MGDRQTKLEREASPLRMSYETFLLGDDGRYAVATLDSDGQFHSAVLPGFRLPVDWLWQESLPTLRDVMKTWETVGTPASG